MDFVHRRHSLVRDAPSVLHTVLHQSPGRVELGNQSCGRVSRQLLHRFRSAVLLQQRLQIHFIPLSEDANGPQLTGRDELRLCMSTDELTTNLAWQLPGLLNQVPDYFESW